MEHPGLSGIGQNIGEYNVPYMLFLAIVGRTSFDDLYEIKNLSVLFDFLGSAAAVLLLSKIKGTKSLSPLKFIAIFCTAAGSQHIPEFCVLGSVRFHLCDFLPAPTSW